MAALAPTLSHISVMGLVTIPSTMSGQLLGGFVPIQVGMLSICWPCSAALDLFVHCC